MAPIRHIFIDDGDVMNDNRVRGPQWQRLVGEFFVPRLGGTMEAWAAANAAIVEPAWDRFWQRLEAGDRYADIHVDYETEWLASMCREVGVALPAGRACTELAHAAAMFVTRSVRAAYPGVIETIRDLGLRYELYTASNEHSAELEGYLEGMGVAKLFHGFYGGDLVDVTKHHDAFYGRMFAHAGVDPSASLVIDDKIEFLRRARATGALVVRVGAGTEQGEDVPTIASLAELPVLLHNGTFDQERLRRGSAL
jgi:FMN phosphatase YigB (HAD superfamily)